MILYRTPYRFIATTTLLAARCCRGYLSPCVLLSSRKRASTSTSIFLRHHIQRSTQATAVRLGQPSHNTLAPNAARALSTALSAGRKPMVGPAPPPALPAPPLYDADGKELSKPSKRKVAIVVGYVGTGFHGWQQSTDKDVRTVEGELETALWKAGTIADSNYGDLSKIGWGRTSRTDKGVHASKTVASAKLLLPQETFTDAGLSQYGKDKLNEHLPEDIRCFSISKVPKSFRGRDECTLREYTYYLPKHLLPDDEVLEKFRGLLKNFVGTHSFHNFASTKGRQLKEVRRRVQASIDLKKAGGVPAKEGDDVPAGAEGSSAEEAANKKRDRSYEWKTYRQKKKSPVEQREDDDWFGKSKDVVSANSENGGEVKDAEQETSGAASASAEAQRSEPISSSSAPEADKPAEGTSIDGAALTEKVPAEDGVVAVNGENTEAVSQGEAEKEGDEGPEKVLLLRELRTSVYRCEALEDIVSYRRDGEETADEFVRIDIRGKAFVYNQIRLMIGGAIAEARKEVMPGFVEAALKTPYKLRVPLAPAEGLVLESQAFTRHANAMVLDPRDLNSIGGTLTVWNGPQGGNNLQANGRLQALLTPDMFEEAERWRDENILRAVANSWHERGTAQLFVEAIDKFFVGQQREERLLKAIEENLSEIAEGERRAEEKYNKFRVHAKEIGSTKYKDLLPKNIATQIVCEFRLLPGNKVSAIQRGVVKRMDEGELPPLAENEEILSFIATTGVDQLALDGGFVAPDVGSVIPTSSVDSADPPAAVKPPAVGVVASIA